MPSSAASTREGRFYAVWWPEEAGGPWYGHWGSMRRLFPNICGKRVVDEGAARQFLLDHGDHVYASKTMQSPP